MNICVLVFLLYHRNAELELIPFCSECDCGRRISSVGRRGWFLWAKGAAKLEGLQEWSGKDKKKKKKVELTQRLKFVWSIFQKVTKCTIDCKTVWDKSAVRNIRMLRFCLEEWHYWGRRKIAKHAKFLCECQKDFWLVDLAVYFYVDCLSFNPSPISNSFCEVWQLVFLKKKRGN